MRVPRNPPRSHAKRAAWEAQRQRLERCGLSTAPIAAPVVSRSLSLRATSFKEAVPGRSEFPKRGKSAPTSTKVRNRAQAAMLRSGDQLLMSIASRR